MAEIEPTPAGPTYDTTEGRERGSRRQRLYGYLKAANEIRHSYQTQLVSGGSGLDVDDKDIPGGFPDVQVVRNGEEEMILFPSYARKHLKKNPTTSSREMPGTHEHIDKPDSSGDAEYWKREWERFEEENAVVDIDVRGWVFSPHKGPLNRKSRLLVAVARKLSGIPAPAASPPGSRQGSRPGSRPGSRSSSRHGSRVSLEERTLKHEDEVAAKAAQSILDRGNDAAEAAWKGAYSHLTSEGIATPSDYSSRDVSPDRGPEVPSDPHPGEPYHPHHHHHAEHPHAYLSEFSLSSEADDPGKYSLAKRRTWHQPSQMTKEELAAANAHLMSRLKHFMSIPLANTPITIFFYNESKSQSKSITTNDSGHFNLRASLDFVPSSVRVLASENLSATEPVVITDAKGISLISDIDDTIKHSAITAGANEIFKNTFIRELSDLTIQGVKEWYTKLHDMGVQLHYVSNSPWQIFPLLRSYFSLAGLPKGSFHLKQYTGILQGIFEPAAERKRGSVDRIFADFPERRFILVGDSGEADLEVYTDVVMANPGRVLAVFIRDVTTVEHKKFFDQAVLNEEPDSLRSRKGKDSHASIKTESTESQESRPSLPDRRNAMSLKPEGAQPTEGNLIDLDDEIPEHETKGGSAYHDDLLELDQDQKLSQKAPPPKPPSKPAGLRSPTQESHRTTNHDRMADGSTAEVKAAGGTGQPKSPPPKPRRPSTAVVLPSTFAHSQPEHPQSPPKDDTESQDSPTRPAFEDQSSSSATVTQDSIHANTLSRIISAPQFSRPEPHSGPEEERGYATAARRQIAAAYNALPSIRSSSPARDFDRRISAPESSTPAERAPPVLPLRRAATTNRWTPGSTSHDPATSVAGAAAQAAIPHNKKEEMWKRRWARSADIMKREGVLLKTWRVGADVMSECVEIVEWNLKELQHEEGGKGMRRMPSKGQPKVRPEFAQQYYRDTVIGS